MTSQATSFDNLQALAETVTQSIASVTDKIMLMEYVRVSKAVVSQIRDLQREALELAGVDPKYLYEDQASWKREHQPGLTACLKALRDGDTLAVWKLDRLGRQLRHLINTVYELTARGVGLMVLTRGGAVIVTAAAAGKLVFGIFSALAEFERELMSEPTISVQPQRGQDGAVEGAPSR